MLPYVVAPAQHEDRNHRPQQAARLATGILQEHKSQFREGGLMTRSLAESTYTTSEIAISLASKKDTC